MRVLVAVPLVVMMMSKSMLAIGNPSINTFVAEDGRTYYHSPLYCNNPTLYTSMYNKMRMAYTVREDRNCCYLADSRHLCCVVATNRALENCKCDISVTCGATTTTQTTTPTTTTPTTTTPTTTTPTKSLCPAPRFRLLNGEAADSGCPASDVHNITFMNGQISSCNAILTRATVNGKMKTTLLTDGTCKEMLDQVDGPENAFEVTIGNTRYTIASPDFTTVSGPGGTAFIEVSKDLQQGLEDSRTCQESVCPYNSATMSKLINWDQCRIYSWGSSETETMSQNGLNQAVVSLSPSGCKDTQQTTNDLCFKAVSNKNLLCSGEMGAGVYCQAQHTPEWILVGVAAFQMACDETPEVRVLPHPG